MTPLQQVTLHKALEEDSVSALQDFHKESEIFSPEFKNDILVLALKELAPKCVNYLIEKNYSLNLDARKSEFYPNALHYLFNVYHKNSYNHKKWFDAFTSLLKNDKIDKNALDSYGQSVLFKTIEVADLNSFDAVIEAGFDKTIMFEPETLKGKNIFTCALFLISDHISHPLLDKILSHAHTLEDLVKCYDATRNYMEIKKTTQPDVLDMLNNHLNKSTHWANLVREIEVRREKEILEQIDNRAPTLETDSSVVKNKYKI